MFACGIVRLSVCFRVITILISAHLIGFVVSVAEDEIYISDTGRKFGLAGQTLTPRHTIDAILGIKNGDRLLDGKF